MAIAKNGNKQMIHIAMDKEAKERAENIAAQSGMSLSKFIRLAVIEKISQYEPGEMENVNIQRFLKMLNT